MMMRSDSALLCEQASVPIMSGVKYSSGVILARCQNYTRAVPDSKHHLNFNNHPNQGAPTLLTAFVYIVHIILFVGLTCH